MSGGATDGKAIPVSAQQKQLCQVEIPMKEATSLDGIISYLTKKPACNLHEEGLVTITSKSIADKDRYYGPANIADLASESRVM
jgi:hypothetical protein